MDSKTVAAVVLATSVWVGLAVVAVGGATTTRTGEFWMSAKAKIPATTQIAEPKFAAMRSE
jgi:hypothetical protein